MTRAVAVAGERIGPFLIEALIGYGGMAEVYRARHTAIGNQAALKIIRLPDGHAAGPASERFLNEARLMGSLDHPNIVRVTDAGVVDDRAYLAMPLLQGATLKQRLAAGRLPREESVQVLRDLAQALDHAHARGVVHYDVKPGNVLFDGDSARLADFGISRLLDRAEVTESISQQGTPLYMSPEQAAGSAGPASDYRSDLYSLAVIAYEMLTGTTPITGDSPLEVMADHVSYIPARASEHDPGLPVAVDAALARGLAKQPAARYPSASAFVDALAAGLEGTAEPGPRQRGALLARVRGPLHSTTEPRPAARRRRRGRWAMAAGAAAIAAVLLAAGVLLWWPTATPDRGIATPDAPRGAPFYRADFDQALEVSFNDKVGRSSPAARVEIVNGQLELDALTSQGNPGTDLALSQGVKTYVADLAFGVRPGSNVLFCVGLRWAVPGSLANELCANTAEGWIELAIWDGNDHVPMSPRVPVTDMQSGRTISTTVLVDTTHFALWLDGAKVADLENSQVPVAATYPGLDVYPIDAGTGEVDVRRIDLSQIAR